MSVKSRVGEGGGCGAQRCCELRLLIEEGARSEKLIRGVRVQLRCLQLLLWQGGGRKGEERLGSTLVSRTEQRCRPLRRGIVAVG